MNKTLLLGAGIVFIFILAAAVSFWISNAGKKVTMQQVQVNDRAAVTTPVQNTLSATVTPTFTPIKVSDSITRITGSNIVVTGKTGNMTLPKNSSNVDVFKNSPSGRTQVTFDDLKVGQSVSVHIIIPGKKAEIVIEE